MPSPPSLQPPGSATDAPPAAPRRRDALRAAAALAVSAGLVAAVAAAVGPAAIAASLAGADWRLAAAAMAVAMLQVLVAAWRWRFTAARLGHAMPLARAYREYALAWLVNMTLPGGVAGDALRAVRSARSGAGTRIAVRAVILERLSGQLAFWIVAVGGLAAWLGAAGSLPGGAVAGLAAVAAAGAGAAGLTALAARHGPARLRAALAGLWPDVRRAFLDPGARLAQLATGLCLAASYIGVFALAGAAVGAPLPPLAALALVPLALFSMLVPVGVGGWGLREGAAAALWPLAGLTPADGAATAALYGLVVAAAGLPGLAAVARRRPAPSISPASTA